eukprot:6213141-Pleurochrysis_carterae.AAC.3
MSRVAPPALRHDHTRDKLTVKYGKHEKSRLPQTEEAQLQACRICNGGEMSKSNLRALAGRSEKASIGKQATHTFDATRMTSSLKLQRADLISKSLQNFTVTAEVPATSSLSSTTSRLLCAPLALHAPHEASKQGPPQHCPLVSPAPPTHIRTHTHARRRPADANLPRHARALAPLDAR